MALGRTLKEARLKRKFTASEVAAGTRMKVQTVEAIEKEDFNKIPAPLYCKGFIKLYAEFLGLDPDPLTQEYVTKFVDSKHTSLLPESSPDLSSQAPAGVAPSKATPEPAPKQTEDLFTFASTKKPAMPPRPPKTVPINISKVKEQAVNIIATIRKRAVSAITTLHVWMDAKIKSFQKPAKPVIPSRPSPATKAERSDYREKGKFKADRFVNWLKNPVVLASVAAVAFVLLVLIISSLFGPKQKSMDSTETPRKDLPPAKLEIAIEPPAPYVD